MSKKKKNVSGCCSLPKSAITECSLNEHPKESLIDRIRRAKKNMYMKGHLDEYKIIDVKSGEQYTYADLDKLLNN